MGLTCTLTGTIYRDDGAVATGAVVSFTLCAPRNTHWTSNNRVVLRAVLSATTDGSGNFSQVVARNDELTPAGTYWKVECADAALLKHIAANADTLNVIDAPDLDASAQVFSGLDDPDADWVAHGHAQTLTAAEKLQAATNLGLNLSASQLLGQASSGGTGLPVAVALGTGLAMSGTTLNVTLSTGLTVGTTAIASGTSGRILYDNAGVLGELPVGTGVATALAINVGSAGAFITFNGDAGTPSALVGTNISGTAASLTAGLVSSIGDLTGDVTSSNRATTLATVNANVGSFTNASVTVNAKGLVTAASSGTAAVTSITGTANEITVTGTTTPTLSLPSALTLTGKTVTGGTFTGGAFNGTVGATTPATVAGTTITGTSSLTLGTNGGTGGSVVLNGSTSGSATLSVSATGVLALTSFTVGSITVGGGIVSADRITAQNPSSATLGIDINPYNIATQVTAGHPWMRLGGGSNEYLMINAGLTGGYVDICTDLGSGLRVWDGTGGHVTYLTTPATGTLRVTTNGSTLGTVDAASLTLSATTSLLLGTAGSAVGNVGFRNATSGTTTLAPATGALGTGTVTLPLSGTLAISSGTNTFTGVQSMTSPDITTSITTPSTTMAVFNTTATTVNAFGAATTIAMGAAGAGTMNIPLTTSASSATTGALTIGNGTAATNVGIGGGNVNAGAGLTVGNSSLTGSSGRLVLSNGTQAGRLGPTTVNGVLTLEAVSGAPGALVLGTGSGKVGYFSDGTTTAKIRLADNSADASLTCLNLTASGTLAVTGATTLTGNLTSNGAYISTPQALSGNGAVAAVNLTTEVTTIANTGTANTTTTLAAGTNGQKKVISFITDGGFDAVITVTNPAWGGAGTITMNDALDNIEMRYLNSVWQVFINNGCTLA